MINFSKEIIAPIVDKMPIATIVVVIESGTVIYSNKALASMIGKELKYVIGGSCFELFHAGGNFDATICPLQSNRQNLEFIEQILMPEIEKKIDVFKFVQPIIFEDKESLLINFVDISELKDAQNRQAESFLELEKSREILLSIMEDAEEAHRETIALNSTLLNLQRAINFSSEAIAVIDIHGSIQFSNKKFNAIFSGYNFNDEIVEYDYFEGYKINRFWAKILSHDQLGNVIDNLIKGNRYSTQLNFSSSDISVETVLLKIDPYYSEDSEFTGAICLISDMTQRVKAEKTMQQYMHQISRELDENQSLLEKSRLLQLSYIQNDIPAFPTFNIHTLFMPCERLGGDFFRIESWKSGQKMAIVLGDCTDHGIKASLDASLLTSITNKRLKQLFKDDRTDLFLEDINKEFTLLSDDDQFPTLFIAVIDTQTNIITYSNANGELPCYLRDGVVYRLNKIDGMHLGYSSELKYGIETFQLLTGDKFFFFSDAILEIRQLDNLRPGFKFLKELIEYEYEHQSVGRQLDSLVCKLEDRNGGFPLNDDTTLIMFELFDSFRKEYRLHGLSDIPLMLEELRKELSYMDYGTDETEKTIISIDELCLNAFFHGNKGSLDKLIIVNIDANCKEIVIQISDEGDGFIVENIKDPTLNLIDLLDSDIEDIYIHGRGVWIVKNYMDSVSYNNVGNEVIIKKIRRKNSIRVGVPVNNI